MGESEKNDNKQRPCCLSSVTWRNGEIFSRTEPSQASAIQKTPTANIMDSTVPDQYQHGDSQFFLRLDKAMNLLWTRLGPEVDGLITHTRYDKWRSWWVRAD